MAASGVSDRSPLQRLIEPRSVAIVGASGDPGRTAGRPVRYLREHGFGGEVYLVNPRYPEIDGYPCFPSVADLPVAPDVGLVVLGPDRATQAVAELRTRGAGSAIVLAGGYAEIGPSGGTRQAELKTATGSMRLLGPNSMGVVNVLSGATLSPSGSLEVKPLLSGRLGLVSQSGGVMGSILSRAVARGLGFSKLIATGNEADLEVLDIVDYLLDDADTTVIALYIEGLRNPHRLREQAARAQRLGKPIVAFKVGKSEAGARSATSHTGALAGSDRVYDAFFEQLGVIRARTFSDLLDVPAALLSGKRLGGKRLGILTSTGGAGVLVADACGATGFETPPPPPDVVATLSALLTDEAAVADRNPVDVTLAGLKPEVFTGATRALLDSSTYDAALVVVGASGLANPDLAAGPVIECARASTKPLLAYVSPYAPNILSHLNRQGVPAFDTPEGCAAALTAMAQQMQAVSQPQPVEPTIEVPPQVPVGALNEHQARELFAAFGIPSIREVVVATPAEAGACAAGVGERVVLKVLASDLAHKSEVGGVAVGVAAGDVAGRAERMLREVAAARPNVHIEGLLVQEQISGVEVILGMSRDAQLGPTILLGAGGVLAEILQDTVLRVPPLSSEMAAAMIRKLRSFPLLTGYRGQPAADIQALASAIVSFARMVEAFGDRLIEAEINPLFVGPEGQGVRAADGLAIFTAT